MLPTCSGRHAELCAGVHGLNNARQYPALEGRDKEVAALTERAFQALLERHAAKAVDERGQTHLQVRCSVLPRAAQAAGMLALQRNECACLARRWPA